MTWHLLVQWSSCES